MNRADLIPIIVERDGLCWVADCPNRIKDVHEAIVTRGDVQGWKPSKRREIIFHPYNCIGLCDLHHNTENEPKAIDVFNWMCGYYGREVVTVWFRELARQFKVVPGRLKSVIR